MGCKLTRAGDDTAAAAAGSSSDCGDAATWRSPSLTPSTSTLPAPTPSSPSTHPAPTPSSPSPPPAPTPSLLTASSPSPSTSSPPQSPSPTPLSLSSADESSTSTPSSTSSTDEEDQWEEEQNFDQFLQSIEITHPQEDKWGQEQEVDRLLWSLGTAHLSSTRSEIQDTENDDDSGGVPISRSKLGHKELVLTLDNFDNDVITEKITLLSKKYGFFRRVPGDGSCFYRAFIFSYLENTVEIKDDDKRKTEAARLRQRVETYMLACYRHNEDLLPAFYGFESVVNLIEQGLAVGELYHMEMTQHVTSQILPLLRLLTEIEICTREDYYSAFLVDSYESVFELCLCEVRLENGEASELQITALANALGIPLVVETLDGNSPVMLNTRHHYPSRESEAEELELEQSIDSDDSTTPMAHFEHEGSRNLSPAQRRRLVTLLYRPGHYDIIYPK